ncbi:UNVERIFIED_CONTAM: hypothetical protein K2H54_057527 [Gekko kuhli]
MAGIRGAFSQYNFTPYGCYPKCTYATILNKLSAFRIAALLRSTPEQLEVQSTEGKLGKIQKELVEGTFNWCSSAVRGVRGVFKALWNDHGNDWSSTLFIHEQSYQGTSYNDKSDSRKFLQQSDCTA